MQAAERVAKELERGFLLGDTGLGPAGVNSLLSPTEPPDLSRRYSFGSLACGRAAVVLEEHTKRRRSELEVTVGSGRPDCIDLPVHVLMHYVTQ